MQKKKGRKESSTAPTFRENHTGEHFVRAELFLARRMNTRATHGVEGKDFIARVYRQCRPGGRPPALQTGTTRTRQSWSKSFIPEALQLTTPISVQPIMERASQQLTQAMSLP